jgi:hypothetical protein
VTFPKADRGECRLVAYGRVGHELPDLLSTAAGDGGLGSPLQRLLAGATRLSAERVRAHHGPHRLRGHRRLNDNNSHQPPFRAYPERRAQSRLLPDTEDGRLGQHHHRAGDTVEEIDKLRQGGDGHIVVWGGVSLWRSLMRLDLIDGLQLSLFPYVAGEGTRLFDGVPSSYRLDLVSSNASSNGILELQYRRHR